MDNSSLAISLRMTGFSLFELLASISISAALLFNVVPELNYLISKSMLETRANSLIGALKQAKLTSIKRSQSIVICSIQKGSDVCKDAADKNNNWDAGWLIFADQNGNNAFDSSDKIIQIDRFASSHCSITWNRKSDIRFYRFGALQGGKAGRFDLKCKDVTTQLVLNWVGRVRRESLPR